MLSLDSPICTTYRIDIRAIIYLDNVNRKIFTFISVVSTDILSLKLYLHIYYNIIFYKNQLLNN